MNYVIEGSGALVNEKGEEQPLKAGGFALVNKGGVVHPLKVDDFDLMDSYEKHQDRNFGDVPFKMICWVPKEFE